MGKFTEKFTEALSLGDSGASDVNPRAGVRGLQSAIFRRRRKNRADRLNIPVKEFERDWKLYQTVPLLRAPINQFADDVMGDGYRIDADSSDTVEFLREWSKSAAIIAGESNVDLRELLHGIPVQHEARGTAMVEKAPAAEDSEKIAGLTFIPPETVTPYRRPNSSMLLQPEDTELDNAKLTDNGEAAAYVQYDTDHGDSESENRFAQTDVVKITNDADPNSVFGTSSIAPVANRTERLLQKLADNEQAIESKAWGQWFFGFEPMEVDGEIYEWDEDGMDAFMDELDDIEPGSMISHDGTINIENIPGEVADIIENLKFDLHYILTSMPAPTYSVGFESDINQFVVDAQETRHNERVDNMRAKIERALTPVLREVAKQNGYNPDGVKLRLEAPEEDSPILSLSDSDIEKIERYSKAVERLSGDADPATMLSDEALRDLILQLPEDASPATEEALEALDLGGVSEDGEAVMQAADAAESGAD